MVTGGGGRGGACLLGSGLGGGGGLVLELGLDETGVGGGRVLGGREGAEAALLAGAPELGDVLDGLALLGCLARLLRGREGRGVRWRAGEDLAEEEGAGCESGCG